MTGQPPVPPQAAAELLAIETRHTTNGSPRPDDWRYVLALAWQAADAYKAGRAAGAAAELETLRRLFASDKLAWSFRRLDDSDEARRDLAAVADLLDGTGRQPHEFTEDVADASMCVCGLPALNHDLLDGTAGEPGGDTP